MQIQYPMNFLIVGLGNIGPQYLFTRHNIGFMAVDYLAKQKDLSFKIDRLASVSSYKLKGHTIYLIKPTTFMNLSGKALNYWMQELAIPAERVLIVVDDLALPFGTVRLKPKGSNAGHNGLKSIEAVLGHSDYPRIRFGIGDNFPKGHQVDYVLSGFDADEQPELPALIDRSIQMIESFVAIGPELTMTNFNK